MPRGSWAYIQFVDRPGGRPDQGLPSGGGRPTDPDFGIDEGPTDPGWGIPEGGGGRPPRPGQGLPSGGRPDQGLPKPPVGLWPPPNPGNPVVPIPPDVDLPPGTIWPSLPEGAEGKYLVLAWVSGDSEHSGWHYVVVDTSVRPDQGLPGEGGEEIDNTLPETPEPKQNRSAPPPAGRQGGPRR